MLSSFAPWCAERCISASAGESQKPHQGFAGQNPILHRGVEWSKSTLALGLPQWAGKTASGPAVAANNGKGGLLNCTINTANKITITNAIAHIPGVGKYIPEGSWGRAGLDVVGGNAISGLLATGQTLFGNSASGRDVAQAGAGILLDPSMGLGPALEAGGVNVPSAIGALTDTVAEGATGVGLFKLGADALLTAGSATYCLLTHK